MASISNIAIAILAAGASTRMGTPKQLLNWGGISLLNHAIATSIKVSANEVIVVLGANKEMIAPEISSKNISVIINNQWEQGLGKSISCATGFVLDSHKKFDGILILLADQPFVSTSYLNQMVRAFSPNSKDIIATSYREHKIGVPVLFNKAYFNELSQLSGDEGAKSLLKKHSDFIKVLNPDFKNFDVDTKDDYRLFSKGKLN